VNVFISAEPPSGDPAGFPSPAANDESTRAPESAQPALRPDLQHSAPPRWTEQHFVHEGVEWIARLTGSGAGGTGSLGLAPLLALRFYRTSEPELPVREALVARARVEDPYPEELRALLTESVLLPP
jgi:hypothetical protein